MAKTKQQSAWECFCEVREAPKQRRESLFEEIEQLDAKIADAETEAKKALQTGTDADVQKTEQALTDLIQQRGRIKRRLDVLREAGEPKDELKEIAKDVVREAAETIESLRPAAKKTADQVAEAREAYLDAVAKHGKIIQDGSNVCRQKEVALPYIPQDEWGNYDWEWGWYMYRPEHHLGFFNNQGILLEEIKRRYEGED